MRSVPIESLSWHRDCSNLISAALDTELVRFENSKQSNGNVSKLNNLNLWNRRILEVCVDVAIVDPVQKLDTTFASAHPNTEDVMTKPPNTAGTFQLSRWNFRSSAWWVPVGLAILALALLFYPGIARA